MFVFTTGLRNLNHIYGGRDDDSWIGFTVFALSMVVLIVGWQRAGARLRPATSRGHRSRYALN